MRIYLWSIRFFSQWVLKLLKEFRDEGILDLQTNPYFTRIIWLEESPDKQIKAKKKEPSRGWEPLGTQPAPRQPLKVYTIGELINQWKEEGSPPIGEDE